MTVNYNFDLEDDDFFDAAFLSISENDILTSTAVSKVVSSDQKSNELPKENLKQECLHRQIENSSSAVCAIENNKREHFNFSKRTFENEKSRSEDKRKSNQSLTQESGKGSLVIDSRFIPGFTPKAKKRKFPGPAGICSQENKLELLSTYDLDKSCAEKLESDADILGTPSSQLSNNELLLSSWQNLQKDVSSCPAFLSTAKNYSIQMVLNETSKKKLPKHIEVPVLCVLIKKFKIEDSSIILMDDTGEIPGKIYDRVLDTYKEYVKAGTALILRKVTFVCNILLLQEESVASIYLEDGSVKHIHDLKSILNKEEPLKPMSCEYPGTPKTNESGVAAILKMCDATLNAVKKSSKSNLLNIEANCKTPCTNSNFLKQRINSNSPNNLSSAWTPSNANHLSKVLVHTAPVINSSNVIPSVKENISSPFFTNTNSHNSNSLVNKVTNINSSHVAAKASDSSLPSNENTMNSGQPVNSVEGDDLFCDGSGMDEFDELLCSLDEKSFLEEI